MTKNHEPENPMPKTPQSAGPQIENFAPEDPAAAPQPSQGTPLTVGNPTPPTSTRRLRPVSVAAAVVGLAIGGVAVATYAVGSDDGRGRIGNSPLVSATADPNGSQPQDSRSQDRREPGRGDGRPEGRPDGRGPRAGMIAGLGRALHGELVMPQRDGSGVQTVLLQTGAVTAVNATSLSVRSSDGFTATYVINEATRAGWGGKKFSPVSVGEDVRVIATKDGSVATARQVMSRDDQVAPQGGLNRGREGGPGGGPDAGFEGGPGSEPSRGSDGGPGSEPVEPSVTPSGG